MYAIRSYYVGLAASFMLAGRMLQYPAAWAGGLILLIETGLTLSLGLILAGLFLCLCRIGGEDDEGRP